jgi:catalase
MRLSDRSRAKLVVRFVMIGLVIAGIAGLFAFAGGWLTPGAVSQSSMINGLQQVNGPRPGFRRNHAKGVSVGGYFESNGHGVELSKAAVFLPGRVPIIGRFTLAGGRSYVTDEQHTTRSMAIQFKTANGEEWRMGTNNIPVFPVNTAEGFYDQLLASKVNPETGKPDPIKMKAFLAKHPESAKAMELIRSYPVSSGLENSTYNGLNAFFFVNAKGTIVPVRWSMVPTEPFHPFTGPAGTDDKNSLFDGLIDRVHQHPLKWRLIITVGQIEDPTIDATVAWPLNRQQVDVGTLTIDHIESEDTSPARAINFDLLVLPNGITASDDPLLSVRLTAYSVSFTGEGER